MASEFLTYIQEQMWTMRYAKRTIKSYLYWIKAYIIFNNKAHPKDCHDREVGLFLTHLTTKLNVAPKTQALALNSVAFLYRHILKTPLSLDLNFNKSTAQPKLPVVLTTDEIGRLLR
jgi:site-specific recombinase XerD